MSLIECIQDQGPYYRKLKLELASLDTIKKELESTEAERCRLESDIQTKKTEINSLSELSKKEFKDVRKLKHLSFKSAAATLSGRKKEKIEKEEAKYQLAFENEQRSKRILDELESKYETILTKEATLSEQMAHFKEVQLQYESMIEQVFQLEDPQFPAEPQLRADIRNYKDQKRLATKDRARFLEAEKYFDTAISEIKKAISLLDSVINYVPFEIFGGPIIDEEQVAYLEAVKRKIWAIQKLLNAARTTLPEIPHPQTLDTVTNNPLLQMQLSIYYIDISWRTKTSQCYTRLSEVYRHTQNAMKWTRQYKDYSTGAIVALNTAILSAKEALEKERMRIMDVVLSGQAPTHNDEPPLFTVTPSDLPPPVYEAPPPTIDDQHDTLALPTIPSGFSSPVTSCVDLTTNPTHSASSDTNTPNPNDKPYISHNVNNPFANQ